MHPSLLGLFECELNCALLDQVNVTLSFFLINAKLLAQHVRVINATVGEPQLQPEHMVLVAFVVHVFVYAPVDHDES
jgi:hypothetical protein